MNEEAFRRFLKRGGRKAHVVDTVIHLVRHFEAYLNKFLSGKTLNEATPEDLETYVQWYEQDEEATANRHLWGIRYYYRFTNNRTMAIRVSELREARTSKTRKSFRIRDFRGVNEDYVGKLEAVGIRDVEQMRQQGATPTQRADLAEKTGIPEESILVFVRLSDLARLPGVKAIRTRLYYDAGIDTLEKMAKWDPVALRLMLIEFVEKTGFDGIAPLPKEAANAVKVAGELPRVIEY
ncbi:MAG: DUF4332 domain-containing protein [Candidatus Hermodarchaeia archaeon]